MAQDIKVKPTIKISILGLVKLLTKIYFSGLYLRLEMLKITTLLK